MLYHLNPGGDCHAAPILSAPIAPLHTPEYLELVGGMACRDDQRARKQEDLTASL